MTCNNCFSDAFYGFWNLHFLFCFLSALYFKPRAKIGWNTSAAISISLHVPWLSQEPWHTLTHTDTHRHTHRHTHTHTLSSRSLYKKLSGCEAAPSWMSLTDISSLDGEGKEGLEVPGCHPPAHWHPHGSIPPNPFCFHGNYRSHEERRMWEEEVGGRKMEWGR